MLSGEWAWECIADNGEVFATHRMKVPGGWIVRTSEVHDDGVNDSVTSAMVFVPEDR